MLLKRIGLNSLAAEAIQTVVVSTELVVLWQHRIQGRQLFIELVFHVKFNIMESVLDGIQYILADTLRLMTDILNAITAENFIVLGICLT